MSSGELVYIKKLFWPSVCSASCCHCGAPIKYRPTTIGVGEAYGGHGIKCSGYFCSWPCARAYANDFNVANSTVELLTTSILSEFKYSLDAEDDPCGYQFLRNFSRFSEIRSAPRRENFLRFGGSLTDDGYRALWTGVVYSFPSTSASTSTTTSTIPMSVTTSTTSTTIPTVTTSSSSSTQAGFVNVVGASTDDEQNYYSVTPQFHSSYGFSLRRPVGARGYQYFTGSTL
jgi:hypothetical protein